MSRIPGTVWALGAVSLLMDLSSELVHSLLPVLMVTVLGASMLAVGVVGPTLILVLALRFNF